MCHLHSRMFTSGRYFTVVLLVLFAFLDSPNGKYFALKQIEGTGISMSACREIAVSKRNLCCRQMNEITNSK